MLHALTLSLSLSTTAFAGPGGLLSDPEASRLLSEAQAAYEAQDFAKAADLLEQAYMIEPNEQLLYPWAQAERESGDCETAIDLYKRVLESNPPETLAANAQGNIDRCQEQLDEADMVIEDDADDEPVDDLVDEPDTPPEPDPEPAPIKPREDEGKDTTKAWYKDPVGGVLVGIGVAGVVTGGALMGVASSRAKSVGDADTNQDYVDAKDSAKTLNTGGVVALSVGGALLVGGIIRYAIVAKKNKAQTARLFVSPAWARGAGVSISGRF